MKDGVNCCGIHRYDLSPAKLEAVCLLKRLQAIGACHELSCGCQDVDISGPHLRCKIGDGTDALSCRISSTARSSVLDAAGSLASRIGAIANGIQGLRSDAESRIGAAVTRANELLAGIASLNAKW